MIDTFEGFLPIRKSEIATSVVDFVVVSGDAYVDHPSFGHAVIGRLVQSQGFSVGMIACPTSDSDFLEFGEPKHAFLVGSGVVDSMVNNYTAAMRKRSSDVYAPGGKIVKPDRALTVYCKTLKRLFPNCTIIIGGIEASLRRFAHYDFWSDKVMPSILLDTCADLLIFGMGERPLLDLLSQAAKGIPLKKVKNIEGTSFFDTLENLPKQLQKVIHEQSNSVLMLDDFDQVCSNKMSYAKTFKIQHSNTDNKNAKILVQKHGQFFLVQNKPQRPLTQEEMDFVYALPYKRNYHPSYIEVGGVAAIAEVQFSLTSQRGCFGSCNFCALTFHQGRTIQNRSHENIIEEAKLLTQMSEFKGYIHDVGGPTANFRNTACQTQKKFGVCQNKSCIGNKACKNLEVDHKDYLSLLQKLRQLEKVKKVFVRSGIRFDYLMMDKDDQFFNELVKYHISGQLKVAPEHVVDEVLEAMNKPNHEVYEAFVKKFKVVNERHKMNQFVVPYLISSHPGCTIKHAVKLAVFLKSINYMPEQVQDFYPTPSTKSTTMFYTGLNPDTLKPIYVPKSKEEKSMQRALLQWRKKENYFLVKKALELAQQTDLIGFGKDALIRPLDNKFRQAQSTFSKQSDNGNFRRASTEKPEREAPGAEKKLVETGKALHLRKKPFSKFKK